MWSTSIASIITFMPKIPKSVFPAQIYFLWGTNPQISFSLNPSTSLLPYCPQPSINHYYRPPRLTPLVLGLHFPSLSIHSSFSTHQPETLKKKKKRCVCMHIYIKSLPYWKCIKSFSLPLEVKFKTLSTAYISQYDLIFAYLPAAPSLITLSCWQYAPAALQEHFLLPLF